MSKRWNHPSEAVAIVALLLTWGAGHAQNRSSRAPQGYPFTLNFETGDLRGWTPSGTAFRYQPTLGDNPRARPGGQSVGLQGRWWVGTYERYRGGRDTLGNFQGDRPQGTLVSSRFRILPGSLSFLVGGGAGSGTRVELVVTGALRASAPLQARGRNSETMRRECWDLTEYAGSQGQIRIVDESSGPWGHINVDDFQFSGLPCRQAAAARRPVEVPSRAGVDTARARMMLQQRASPIVVPRLIGLSIELANRQLSSLRLRSAPRRDSLASERPGTVVAQRPLPGTQVRQGSSVELWVSRWSTMPRLIDQTLAVAQQLLERQGLKVGQVAAGSSDRPAGTILRQSPDPGAVIQPGTRVDLVVASAVPDVTRVDTSAARRRFTVQPPVTRLPQGVEVPSLAGIDTARARVMLQQTRLVLGRKTLEPSSQPFGTVVRQDPGAGTRVGPGDSVHVVVASPIVVPRLIGLSIELANRQLSSLRLRSAPRRDSLASERPGTVVAQRPAPRTPVHPGDSVDLWVSRWSTVPRLIDQTLAAAGQLLERQGLHLGQVEHGRPDRLAGTVVGQSRDPGEVIPPGTPVDVEVGTGVAVPNIVGIDTVAARRRLAAESLLSRVTKRTPSPGRLGRVRGQTPAAGAIVGPQTVIDLDAAIGVIVPSVVDLDLETARDSLNGLGLGPVTVQRESSPKPIGNVFRQSPPPGSEVPLGSGVQLTVAQGVQVPLVEGLHVDSARVLIQRRGLRFGTSRSEGSPRPTGTVLTQDPPAGRLVPLQTPVNLAIAGAVEVPGVVGLDSAEAKRVLTGRELRAAIVADTSASPMGSVLSQTPDSGTAVPLATVVTMRVAVGVAVPAVVNTDSVTARRQLQAAGLQLGTIERSRRISGAGTVLEQTPAPGGLVPLGTAVNLTVAASILPLAGLTGLGLGLVLAATTLLYIRPRWRIKQDDLLWEKQRLRLEEHDHAGQQSLEGTPRLENELSVVAHPDPGTQSSEGDLAIVKETIRTLPPEAEEVLHDAHR